MDNPVASSLATRARVQGPIAQAHLDIYFFDIYLRYGFFIRIESSVGPVDLS